jgi:RNA polymerase sigma-70 factor (ECF subfamily)
MEASATLTGPAREGATPAALPAAFERLFVAEYGRVAGIAYRVLGDKAEAEDVAQEVFLSFYRRHRADASYAPAWLYAAAAHTALNSIRGRKRRERREDTAGRAADRVADPETEAIAAEERAHVRGALARLPTAAAALLVLRYSGLAYAEVAAALGIPADQVGTRLRRAQEALKKEVLRGPARP